MSVNKETVKGMTILFLFVGMFIFGLGVFILWDHFNYLREAIETNGWVKAYKKVDGNEKNHPSFYPIVNISAGKYREFTSDSGSSHIKYMIGDPVTVFYKEGERPKLKSNMMIYLSIFLMIFGFIFMYVFYITFSFNVFTAVIWAGLLFTGFGKFRKTMLDNGIRTWADLKEEYKKQKADKSKMSFSVKNNATPPELLKGEIISSNRSIYAHKAAQAKSYRVSGPIILLIGIGILVGGYFFMNNRYEFLQIAIPTKGTVVSLEESYSDDSYTYYPIVEYQVPNSYDVISFRHNTGSNPPTYAVGDKVDVLYNPYNLEDAMIDNGILNYFWPSFVILLGLLFTFGGLSSIRMLLKRKEFLRLSEY